MSNSTSEIGGAPTPLSSMEVIACTSACGLSRNGNLSWKSSGSKTSAAAEVVDVGSTVADALLPSPVKAAKLPSASISVARSSRSLLSSSSSSSSSPNAPPVPILPSAPEVRRSVPRSKASSSSRLSARLSIASITSANVTTASRNFSATLSGFACVKNSMTSRNEILPSSLKSKESGARSSTTGKRASSRSTISPIGKVSVISLTSPNTSLRMPVNASSFSFTSRNSILIADCAASEPSKSVSVYSNSTQTFASTSGRTGMRGFVVATNASNVARPLSFTSGSRMSSCRSSDISRLRSGSVASGLSSTSTCKNPSRSPTEVSKSTSPVRVSFSSSSVDVSRSSVELSTSSV